MKQPRLSAHVLDGLVTLAGIVEAGGSADMLGYSEDSPSLDRKAWDEICDACDWIRKVQALRAEAK